MMSFSWSKLLLFSLIFISLFYGLNAPLFDEDEGFYAEASREMLLHKEFITITVNGQHRYDKPPLVFWMVAASQFVFGESEWAVRLPSVLMSLALIVLLYNFSRKYAGKPATRNVLLLFAGSIQISMISRAAIADSTLHFCIVFTLFSLWNFIESGKKKSLVLAYTSAAFAFLAKGPVAVVIPAVVVLVYVVRWKEWKLLLNVIHLPSLLLFFIIVLPWFYLCYQKVGFFVIEDFFLKHNIGRFTNTMESHGGGWFYYVPVFFLGLLPFSIIHLRSLIRSKTLLFERSGFFMLTWFCLVFLIFSASGTKLPHYILLGYVPLILISAGRDLEKEWRSVAWSGLFLLLIFFSAPLIAPGISPKIPDEYVRALISGSVEFDLLYYILMACGMLIILSVIVFYKPVKEKILLIAVVVIFSFSTFFIYYGRLQQSPVKEIALSVSNVKEDIVMLNHYLPSFSFYSHRVCEIREPREGELAFGKIVDFRHYKIRIIREKYGVGLVRIMKPDQ